MSAPRWALALLRRVAPPERAEDVLGDLEEAHRARVERRGRVVAQLLTCIEALDVAAALVRTRVRSRRAAGARTAPGVAFSSRRRTRGGLTGGRISWLDFKLGLRMLARYPGLTLVGGFAIAVGVAIAAAYLEFVSDIWRPKLPLPDGDRIVGIQTWNVVESRPDYRVLHDFVTWREQLRSVEELGAFQSLERNLVTEDGRAEPVRGVRISASAFRLAGERALLGRTLVEADEAPAAPPVVVLGYALWQARFGGEADVVGSTVRLGDATHTVVGVMPEGFAFPMNHRLWVPLRPNVSEYERGEAPPMMVFGRLARGATLEEAQAELSALGARAAAAFPATNEHLRPRIMPYVESLYGRMWWQVYLLQSFLTMVLVVACINVAALLYARTAAREAEIAVRSALGASRGRIVMQLFAEALVLAAVGAAAGLAVVRLGQAWGVGIFFEQEGEPAPFWWDHGLSPVTVLYTAGLAVLGAAVAGIAPALKATGGGVQSRLRSAAAGGSGLRFGRLSTGVIVGQVALCVLFLPGAIGMAREALRYRAGDDGIEAERYLSARLEMDFERPPADSAGLAAFVARYLARVEELARRLEAEPGVEAITLGTRLPGTIHPERRVEADGVEPPADDVGHEVRPVSVEPDFFDVFRAPLLAGRAFHSGDFASGARVAIANRSFVERVLGGRGAVGRRVRYVTGDGEPGPWYEIVGVVPDLGTNVADPVQAAALYHPLVSEATPGGRYPAYLAVRVAGDPGAFAPRLRALAAAHDPALRLYELVPLADVQDSNEITMRFFVPVTALVVFIALLLSAAGIYSLMAFTVSQRTREIGIRAALGAGPRRIVRAIFSRAFVQIGAGVVVGGILAALLHAERLAREGPGLLIAGAAVMAVVGLLACVVPAGRALRIEPTEALREA